MRDPLGCPAGIVKRPRRHFVCERSSLLRVQIHPAGRAGAAVVIVAARQKRTAGEFGAFEQIAQLHTVSLLAWNDRGSLQIPSFDSESKVPTDVLYRIGVDALPALAEALDDETPSETETNTRWEMKVWKVNELAARLVWLIADRDFILETPRLWVEMSSGAGGPHGGRRRRESSRNRQHGPRLTDQLVRSTGGPPVAGLSGSMACSAPRPTISRQSSMTT